LGELCLDKPRSDLEFERKIVALALGSVSKEDASIARRWQHTTHVAAGWTHYY